MISKRKAVRFRQQVVVYIVHDIGSMHPYINEVKYLFPPPSNDLLSP